MGIVSLTFVMIRTLLPRQGLGQAFIVTVLFIVYGTATPIQDAYTNVGSPISWASQTLSSSEETDVSVQEEHQGPIFQSQPDEDFHPFLDVDDLSAEYEYDYRSNESDEEDGDEDQRIKRSLMGRGSTARGGGRRGGGDVSRRRDGNRNDYGGGSHYTWTPKRAPIPAPAA